MSQTNLTIPIDDGVLKRARIKALRLGTSVAAEAARHLEDWVGAEADNGQIVEELIRFSDELAADPDVQAAAELRGPTRWTREDAYD